MRAEPPLAGVMGWPVAHSRSPIIHGFWLEELGLDGHYIRLPVEPGDLAAALHALPSLGFRGVNLTAPHKEAALRHVDSISDAAVGVGAVNTIEITAEGESIGHNSDVLGIVEPLEAVDLVGRPVCVFGAGGAARAALAALRQKRVGPVRLVNRSIARGTELLDHFRLDGAVHDWAHAADALTDAALVLNTSSLGMVGQPPLSRGALALERSAPDAVVFDAVYAPLETALLGAAAAHGRRVVDGLAMLIGQAAFAFEQFFGQPPPRERDAELRRRLVAAPSR